MKRLKTLLWVALIAWNGGGGMADEFRLNMPIGCVLGETCVIQQFVDHQVGDDVRDYGCGRASYNGHNGTDFRVTDGTDFARGVPVFAAAGGVVKGMRDGEPDLLKRSEEQLASTIGKECGNGMALDHGQGWETQYCHLRKGSVRVRAGDVVAEGEILGFVGLSGRTQFPHLHISVRKDGAVIDPFTGKERSATCDQSRDMLWAEDSQLAGYVYRPTQIINIGLADAIVSRENVDAGAFEDFKPNKDAPLMVAYGRVINLKKGDRIQMSFVGPNGVIAENLYDPLEKDRAVELRYLGKKRPSDGWPEGAYSAYVEILRGEEIVDTATVARILR